MNYVSFVTVLQTPGRTLTATLLFLLLLLLSTGGANARTVIHNPYTPLEIRSGWEIQSYGPDKQEVWRPVSLPHFLRTGGEKKSVIHYRFRFVLDERPRIPLAVVPGKITDVDRTYLNGTLIGAEGRVTPREHASDIVRLYYLPSELLLISGDKTNENEILVEVFTGTEGGGFRVGPFLFGPQHLLQQALFFQQLPMLLLGALTVVFALFFLQLYFFQRRGTSVLYLALLCLPAALHWLNETQFKFSLPVSYLNLLRLKYLFLFILPTPAFLFLFSLPRLFWPAAEKRDRLTLSLRILPLSLPLISVVLLFADDYPQWIFWRDYLFLPLTLLIGALLAVDPVRCAMRNGELGLRLLLGGIGIAVLCVFNDLAAYFRFYNLPELGPFGFFAFLAISAFVLQSKLTAPRSMEIPQSDLFAPLTIGSREEIAAEVDSTLNRTATSDARLRELLETLTGDQNASATVSSSLVLPPDEELPSPGSIPRICLIDNVQIGGRNHVVSFFLNERKTGEDSTTVLVSGILFQANLDRTRRHGDERKLPPEIWLRLLGEDLRRSPRLPPRTEEPDLFIGLLDEQNGFLYYLLSGLRAAHLNREGEQEPLTPAPPHLAADSVASGRDPGVEREDFRIGVLSLRGDEGIHVAAEIQSTAGSISEYEDDAAGGPAIRLTFHPARVSDEPDPEYRIQFQEALKQARENRRAEAINGFRRLFEKRPDLDAPAFNLAQLLKKENDLEQAVFYYEISSRINPGEEKYIYQCALGHYRLRDYERAEESALRLLLRNPGNAEALLLLTDIERRLRRIDRARRYLDRARTILGDEPRVQRLRKLLKA